MKERRVLHEYLDEGKDKGIAILNELPHKKKM